ncbi:putative adenylate kinase [Dioscorea sansibarensis]
MACLSALALEASSLLSSSSHTNRAFSANSPPSSKSPKACLRIDSGCRRRPLKGLRSSRLVAVPLTTVQATQKVEPLKVMISGAPASGKGTQCEFIEKKYGLVHISAGDLLRAEVSAGTENGKRAKEHMEKGMLAPDEIVVLMVKERLLQPDAQQNGWLLDGYPRSASQAKALEDLGIRPDIFILLDVDEETLVERVVGRRLDPVTGKIYHLKYSPPENEEIAARLTQRFDDTEERVKLRLQTHHQNVEAVLSVYKDLVFKVDGNARKDKVFAEIDKALSALLKRKSETDSASTPASLTY